MTARALLLAMVVAGCGGEPDHAAPAAADGVADTMRDAGDTSPEAVAVAPDRPTFQIDLSPGEGVPVLETRGRELVLRTGPDDRAPVAMSVPLPTGTRLTFDSTRYQTSRPARVTARRDIVVEGRSFGPIDFLRRDRYYRGPSADTTFSIASGDAFEVLQYRAEGTCFIRVAGNVIDAETCPTLDADAVDQEMEPVTLWWIRVVSPAPARGWVYVSDTTAAVIDRTF